MNKKSKLKIGVMLNGYDVPQWVAEVIHDIQKKDFLKVSLILLNEDRPPKWRRFFEILHRFLYNVYERAERFVLITVFKEEDPFRRVNIEKQIKSVPTRKIHPLRKKQSHYFTRTDIEAIRKEKLDVIVRFGFNILRGQILKTPRHGVWSFHHGNPVQYRGGPALFWEVYEQNPLSGTVLQILNEQLDAGQIIYRSFAATNVYSLFLNRNKTYWKTSEFCIRCLSDLHQNGPESLLEIATPERGKRTTTPGNFRTLLFLFKLIGRWIKKLTQILFAKRTWFIAYRKRTTMDWEKPHWKTFRPIRPPRKHFYADPFLITVGEDDYLFFEDYHAKRRHGVISYSKLRKNGDFEPPKVALERDYHLSYPFVFEWKGDIYMIPETLKNQTIELYKAKRFPDQWELKKILFKGVHAVDSTLWIEDEKCWLFTNMSTRGGSTWDELFLFYADSPLGPWTPHPQNPIISDVQKARPGGALFEVDGKLIRPSQDCSLRYGYQVNFNQIEKLSTTEYREKTITQLLPDAWDPKNLATHTYNSSKHWEVIDGFKTF